MPEPGVTVVVPTVDREEFLLNTVADLIAQKHRPLEILIVDQSERTSPAMHSLAGAHATVVTYRRVPFRGSAKARNYGWQHARYDAVVFVDDDIRCGPDLVSEHLRSLLMRGVGLVAGGIDAPGERPDLGPPTGRFVAWTATPKTGFGSAGEFDIDHVQECNFSAWRHAFQKVGGIDEAFDVPAALYEGTDLSLRAKSAGFRVCFNGNARLLHLAAPRGGNRVFDTKRYVWGLAHNRAIVISRYLKWFHLPTAYVRLLLLAASYAVHYRNFGVLDAAWRGIVTGREHAKRPRLCSDYRAAVRA